MSNALRLAACLSFSSLLAIPSLAATDFSALEKAVRDDLTATGTPGAAVVVVSGDRVVFAKGFGTSNLETTPGSGPPAAPSTPAPTTSRGSCGRSSTAAVCRPVISPAVLSQVATPPRRHPLYLHMALWAFARAAG